MTSTRKASTDRGAGLAEYAILLLLIAMACIGVLTTLGVTINGLFAKAVSMF